MIAAGGDAAAAVVARPAVARAATALGILRNRIAAQHAAGAPGLQTCDLATELCDTIVRDVWEAILADLADPRRHPAGRLALVAHGGYGRREMAPYSDVDVMILVDAESRLVVGPVAQRLLQDLFDAGLQVGQSVRTVDEACRLAAGDATIMSSLFDCRLLAGAADLATRLTTRLRSLVRRAPGRYAARLVAARREEADRFGQTVALLEPNVKRSPGGLRDIQLVRWLGRVVHDVDTLDDLAFAGGIPRSDADALRDAAEFLACVRNDLHLAAGKPADDLTRAEQVRIAAARGIGSHGGLLGVERFMRDYFRHTRRVAAATESLVQSLERPQLLRALTDGVLGHRVDGRYRVGPRDVGVVSGALPQVTASVAGILRLVELSLLYDLPVEQTTWEAVRAAVPALPRTADAEAGAAFLRLFAHPSRLAEAFRALHEAGLLEIVIPEFVHARHLLQFNSFHKYTVDEHCILAVERAAALAADEGWLGRTWHQLSRKRPLLLALLIHDLGKGFVEDHSLVGGRIARAVTARLGLPEDEAEIVECLVLKHLAMAHLAFRRDLRDDSLVVRFACEVGSPEVLRMLALLTAADVAAVGPGTWTKWKGDLLGELHFRTLGYLDGESPSVAADRARRALDALLAGRTADDPVVRLARALPAAYLRDTPSPQILEELGRLARLPADGIFVSPRWQPDTATVAVTVGTRESVAAGVFHRVVGGLASQRLEIHAADIHTLEDGLVIDHFVVTDPDFAGEPPQERLAEIGDAIRAALRADGPPGFTRRWNPFAPQLPPGPTAPARVLVDNESSERTTILEVFAPDAPGLLYAIAKAIFEAGLSVKSAKIGTYLDQVVDAFHVTDAHGGKLTDGRRLGAIRSTIESVATAAGRR